MAKLIKESVLFRTSAASDIQCSGGVIAVAGLKTQVSKKDITSIFQTIYKAEVAQVTTVGATGYTPVGGVAYKVAVYDPCRTIAGATEAPRVYSYVTPTDVTTLGATAALQREAITVELVAKINADPANHAVAATLTGGAGFTVTDDGGYYPVYAQDMTNIKGVNKVYPITNSDGTGYAATNFSVTTAAVYSSGTGANLLLQKPIISYSFGNLISGVLDAPPVTAAGLAAVSGQQYDLFEICSLNLVEGSTLGNQYVYKNKSQFIWVDNGLGSATTNLAGFKAFERVMHKLMVGVYSTDASTTAEWFDAPIVFQDPLGAAPTGTANTLGWQVGYPTGRLNRTNIGSQTIVAPVLSAVGLTVDQDATAGEGSHTSANQQTLGDQSFIVGKTAFSVTARVVFTDITKAHFIVGFRKKAAYTADFNDYTDMATIGTRTSAALGAVATLGALNNAAHVETLSGAVFVNAVSSVVQVKVALDGTVTCLFNGASCPVYSVGTTALVFDAADEMIPFYQYVNVGSSAPTAVISEFFAVSTDNLIS